MVVMYCKWIGMVSYDRLHSSPFFVDYYYRMDCVVDFECEFDFDFDFGVGDGAVELVIVGLMSNK